MWHQMCKLLTCLSNQIFLSHHCGLCVSLLRFSGCLGDLLACPGPGFLRHSLCTLYHCALLCTVLCTTVCHICDLAGSWCPTDVPFRILCPKLVSWRILGATLWMSFTQNYLLPLFLWFVTVYTFSPKKRKKLIQPHIPLPKLVACRIPGSTLWMSLTQNYLLPLFLRFVTVSTFR